jgi:nucleoside-diphosphate-sugar epimerase
VRPTAIYGPGDDRLLKLFRLIAKGRFVMFGSGEVFFHMIHVDDLVRGLRLAATAPEEAVLGQVFILGRGRVHDAERPGVAHRRVREGRSRASTCR